MEKVIINIHHTNFEVVAVDRSVDRAAHFLKERYTTHSYLYSKPPYKGAKPKLTVVPDKMYYVHNIKDKTYRFPISVLRDFILILGQENVKRDEIKINIDKDFEVAELGLSIKDTYKPKDYQDRYIDALTNEKAKNIALIDLIMGYGKAQPISSRIRIPLGWVTMGDICVGDTITNYDGTTGTVIGKYPQGMKRIYKLTFEDGRTTRACLDHLWKVYPHEDNLTGYLATTEKLIGMINNQTDVKVYIDLPIEFEEQYNPILDNPYQYGKDYMLGLILEFNTDFIYSSIAQRVELLQGLLSDKEWVFNYDEIILNYDNDRVLPIVVELARSLGDIAGVSINNNTDDSTYVLKIYSTKPYRYFIRLEDNVPYDVTVEKYLKDISDDGLEVLNNSNNKLELVDISLDGYEECYCISVDHQEQLYVTDNHIVTHNTFISMYSIVKLNMRTMIIILPKYIDKWLGDVQEYTTVDVATEVYVIRGSESLIELMNMEEIPYKFIIFSMRTMYNYIKEYEEDHLSYPVTPDKLIRKLKIGVILNDETHQEFHALFKASLYFDPPKFIGMTATIETKDKIQDRMYKALFPEDTRISNLVQYVKYIDVKATSYRIDNTRGIKFRRAQGYNHILFEQSIMRTRFGLRNYIEMLDYYINMDFIRRRKPGQKALIFCSTVDLCSLLTNHFARKYPSIDIRRYVQEDPFENVNNAELCFTTVISAGVGLDVKNLIYVLQTISISSMQSNLQVFGRLRDIGDTQKIFRYLYCRNIPDQQRLHHDRRLALNKLSRTYEQEEYPVTVRMR